MSSPQYLTYFLIFSVLVVFPIWELIQLARRKQTMSMYVIARARRDKKHWRIFIILFPLLLLAVSLWLLFHWEGLCISFSLFCDIDI